MTAARAVVSGRNMNRRAASPKMTIREGCDALVLCPEPVVIPTTWR
jgi:hypothetical protein